MSTSGGIDGQDGRRILSEAAPMPGSLDEIDAAWFTAALGATRPGLTVRSIDCETVVHGTATKARYRLDFDGDPADVTAVVWVKAGLEAHQDLVGLGIYATEPWVYATLLPQVNVRAPRSFFSMVDQKSRNGVTVLEDLAARSVDFGSYVGATPVERVRAQLSNFAVLHARWQRDEELGALGLAPVIVRGVNASYFEANGVDVIAEFLDTPRCAGLEPGLRDPKRIYDALWGLADHMQSGQHVVVHGDAHVGNSYYEPDGSAGMYDWQMVRRGCWAHDVTLFMTTALGIEDRRAHERELLEHYLDEVRRFGGSAPPFGAAFDDYRRYLAYGLYCKIVNREYFQPESNNVTSVERFGAAADDLDLFGVLGV